MTRETKVGLLVGLGIILLTCIILTDFLTLPAQNNDPIGPLLNSVEDINQQLAPPAPPPIDSLDEIVQYEQYPMVQTDQGNQPQSTASHYLTHPVDAMAGAEATSPDPLAPGSGHDAAQPVSPYETHTPHTAGQPRQGSQITLPQRIIYYTKPNDNLSDIAAHFYGNAQKWRLIRQANPKAVRPNGGIGVGVRLIIPALDASAPGPRQPSETTRVYQNPVGGQKPYVVQANDRLWDIAQDHLGAGSRYHEILKLNKHVIQNADQLKVGMKLKMPAR